MASDFYQQFQKLENNEECPQSSEGRLFQYRILYLAVSHELHMRIR